MSILVRHAMTESPRAVTPETNAREAAGLMRTEDVGVLPIVDGDDLVGLVTDRDLVIRIVAEGQDPSSVRVGDVATTTPVTVTPDTRLSDARELMERHQIRRLPVVKGKQLVGILSLGDVAWADASRREVGDTLKGVSESDRTRTLNDGADRGTPDRVRQRGSDPA